MISDYNKLIILSDNNFHVNNDPMINALILASIITLNLTITFIPKVELSYKKPIEYLKI